VVQIHSPQPIAIGPSTYNSRKKLSASWLRTRSSVVQILWRVARVNICSRDGSKLSP
jgi:hypothetical protein